MYLLCRLTTGTYNQAETRFGSIAINLTLTVRRKVSQVKLFLATAQLNKSRENCRLPFRNESFAMNVVKLRRPSFQSTIINSAI